VLSDRLGYELLVAAASIAVGGVEKIDADLARPPDRRDPRGAVGLAVEWGHRAAAETDGRDLQWVMSTLPAKAMRDLALPRPPKGTILAPQTASDSSIVGEDSEGGKP